MNPVRLANFVAALNKTVAGKMKKCYPEMDASEVRPFACVSFTRKSFVYFPDVKMYGVIYKTRQAKRITFIVILSHFHNQRKQK